MRSIALLLFISLKVLGQSSEDLRFIQNRGQWNSDIDFQAKVPGGRVGVSAKGFSIYLLDMDAMDESHTMSHGAINESDGKPASEPINGHYFQINLIGADLHSKPVTGTQWDGYYNYFIGNDTCRWASNAFAFASILYPDVYEGIDFRVSSLGNNLKYDFIVRPGADPSQIQIEYCGVDGIEKQDDDLIIQTRVGSLKESKPLSFHAVGDSQQIIASGYRLSQNTVSFSFPDGYNECRELTIDPLLIFSTYSGSTADNWGSTATPGEHGTLYSAGITRLSEDGFFPATTGAFQLNNKGGYDMAIIKYDSAGTKFLYATHLGGSGNDSPQSLVVDKGSGDLIVLGISSSTNFPTGINSFDVTFNGGTNIQNRVLFTVDQWDIVVTRLSASGNILIGSTFLGGSGNDGLNFPKFSGGPLIANYGDEMRGDVITDESGNVYISSVTSSANFPMINGFDNSFNGGTTDGLVVKFSPDLSSIVWSSYLGGAGFDAAYSIKFDADKNLVLAGGTTSSDFPVTVGAYQTTFKGVVDGWIGRVSSDGSTILNATYTGTSLFDQVYFVDLNASGSVFVYGQTSGQMPITSGVFNNANSGQFLQKFDSNLSTLQFSTVFGSGSTNGVIAPNISPTAFLVNDCDNIYMAGWGGVINDSQGFWPGSSTVGMPITTDAFQKTTSGSDFYFIVLNGDATKLVYSTYLGGNSSKTHVDGGTSRFDKFGIVYHAVCSGCAASNATGQATSDFPTTARAKSKFNRSTNCNNAAFKFDLSSLTARFDTNNLALTMPGFNNVCYPDTIVFENLSTGGRTIVWDFDDGTVVTKKNTDSKVIRHQYQQTGQYHVKLTITDLSTCSQTDSTIKIINYFKDAIDVGENGVICNGNSFQLRASGGNDYSWTSSDGLFTSTEPSPEVRPQNTTSYFVTVVDGNNCSKIDTITVDVLQYVRADFQTNNLAFTKPGFNHVCSPDSIRFKNLSQNAQSIIWDFDDGLVLPRLSSDTISIVHSYQEAGEYRVKLKAFNSNTCNQVDSVTQILNYFEDHIEVGDDVEICEGTEFQLTASGGSVYTWSTMNNSFTSSNPTPFVSPTMTTQYFVTVTDGNSCVKKDTIEVSVLASVDLKWQYLLKGSCTEHPSIFVKNQTPPEDGVNFQFDFGDGTTSNEVEVEHVYANDSLYTLNFMAQRKFCKFEESIQLPMYRTLIPNVFTPDVSPGFNDTFKIGIGPNRISPTDIGLTLQLTVVDRWGKNVYESSKYNNDWKANGLEGGVYYIHLKIGEVVACKSWLHIVK